MRLNIVLFAIGAWLLQRQPQLPGAALWLLSDLGFSTTGEVVHVDAGFHMIGLPDGEAEA